MSKTNISKRCVYYKYISQNLNIYYALSPKVFETLPIIIIRFCNDTYTKHLFLKVSHPEGYEYFQVGMHMLIFHVSKLGHALACLGH